MNLDAIRAIIVKTPGASQTDLRIDSVAAMISYLVKNKDLIQQAIGSDLKLEVYMAATLMDGLSVDGARPSQFDKPMVITDVLSSMINSVIVFDGNLFKKKIYEFGRIRATVSCPSPDYKPILDYIDIVTKVRYNGTVKDNEVMHIFNGLLMNCLNTLSYYSLFYTGVEVTI